MKEGRTWTDQELDKAFQEADAQQQAPAFQEAFWDEMEAMLPAKKNRKGFFWFGGAALTLLSIGIVGWTLFSTQADTSLTNKALHVSKTPQKEMQNVSNSTPVVNEKSPVAPANLEQKSSYKPETIIPLGMGGQVVLPLNWKPDFMLVPFEEKEVLANTETETKDETVSLSAKSWNFTRPVTLNSTSAGKIKQTIPYYTEFGLGVGQSYRDVNGENNVMPQVRLGIGLYSRMNGMELSAGIAARAELPSNITRSETRMEIVNGTSTSVRNDIEFKSLYSLEFPLAIGTVVNRHTFSALMTPGFQLAYSGNTSRFEGSTLVRSERSGGNIPSSKTLTMELGGRYMYSINENVQLTGSVSFDIIRPFQSTYYMGTSRNYPVSLFVGLRRTF